MKKIQKSFIILLLIVAITILIVGCGIYLYNRNKTINNITTIISTKLATSSIETNVNVEIRGWISGSLSKVILKEVVQGYTNNSLTIFSGNQYNLTFTKNSECSYYLNDGRLISSSIKEDNCFGLGDRVRVFGFKNDNTIIVDRIESVSSLPVDQW